MSTKDSKSRAAIGSQESWADSISDYILLRRQQTHTAYSPTDIVANTENKPIDKAAESHLFGALFSMLATSLEEGHTVLTIESAVDELASQGQVNGEVVALYAWQQRLIAMLAAPIFALIDTQIDAQSESRTTVLPSIFELLSTLLSQGAQLWAHLTLTNHERKVLNQRLDVVVTLYQCLKNNNITSLIQLIEARPLFADVNSIDNKNSLSKLNQPIIYQIQHAENNSTVRIHFWLHRTWQAEFNLAQKINSILDKEVIPLEITVPDSLNDQQIAAINVANNNAFSIITGGPGTGKTYTVAQLVMALQQATESREGAQENIRFSTDSASLALAAPTGKAAQRMQESLQAALDAANVSLQLQEAKTIHRLLGIGRTGRPRYDANNPLGEDIIIVDEASMLGVELANYLVSAVKSGARLILLGDANQLAAVDAGAVLADLCRIPALNPIHVQLTDSKRFSAESGIGKLAHQIKQNQTNIQAVWQLLKQDESLSFEYVNQPQKEAISSKNKENSLSKKNQLKEISKKYINYLKLTKNILSSSEKKFVPTSMLDAVNTLMQTFNQFRVLSAGHNGEWGDHYINNYLTQWHLNELKLPLGQNTWFHGRPVMILQNNYELGLFNGDIGFCLQVGSNSNHLEVFFENKAQGIATNLLNEEVVTTAYAMTIHKSQGSEFDHVAITFDNSHERLLSKELIYTAVTRAKSRVTVYSTRQAFEKAVQTPTERHTGLALQF